VEAGNFSWQGINCSWDAYNWSWGDDPLANLSMTCTLWDIITVVFANGTVTVTWTNGSWNHTFMPAPPTPAVEAGALAVTPSAKASPEKLAAPAVPTMQMAW